MRKVSSNRAALRNKIPGPSHQRPLELILNNMYTQLWNKYLPVVRLLLKKSLNAEQTLAMNTLDFERAGAGRKTGYKFMVHFIRGRISNVTGDAVLAKDLAHILLQDEGVKKLLTDNECSITLTPKYQLIFKCLHRAEPPAEAPVSADLALVEEAHQDYRQRTLPVPNPSGRPPAGQRIPSTGKGTT